MATSLVKINVHLIFHTKTTSVCLRGNDIPLIHKYIDEIISVPLIMGRVKY